MKEIRSLQMGRDARGYLLRYLPLFQLSMEAFSMGKKVSATIKSCNRYIYAALVRGTSIGFILDHSFDFFKEYIEIETDWKELYIKSFNFSHKKCAYSRVGRGNGRNRRQ